MAFQIYSLFFSFKA